jgi:hypothetical protein
MQIQCEEDPDELETYRKAGIGKEEENQEANKYKDWKDEEKHSATQT